MRHVLLLAAALGFAPLATAQPLSGAYVGFGAGSFDYSEASGGATLVDDSASSWRAFGGYEINKHLSVEGSWGRTGAVHGRFDQDLFGTGPVTVDLTEKYEIYTIRAVGKLPLRHVTLLAGAGYYNARLTFNLRVEGFTGEVNDNSNTDDGGMLLGGVQYDLDYMSIRAEYERFSFPSEIDASQLSINVLFKF